MKNKINTLLSIVCILFSVSCSNEDTTTNTAEETPTNVSVDFIRFGEVSLGTNVVVPNAQEILVQFNKAIELDPNNYTLMQGSQNINLTATQSDNQRQVTLAFNNLLEPGQQYTFTIANQVKGTDGSTFSGASYSFTIETDSLELTEVTQTNQDFTLESTYNNTPLNLDIILTFSESLEGIDLSPYLHLQNNAPLTVTPINSTTFNVKTNTPLDYWKPYSLTIGSELGETIGRNFDEVVLPFTTQVDDSDKFPIISDDELLTKIQEQTFRYFWDFAHPASGMARERNTSGNLVTAGGSGFGLMAMIVGVERNFITRNQALSRWEQMVDFLETCDRFHGAWPHWLNGNTGQVIPFSAKDDGADLVETALLVQGLLTVKEYLDANDSREQMLENRISTLWEQVEWDWFRQNDQNVLYWHWSPNFGWDINLKIAGHNETQLVYIMAAASPTHSIPQEVYTQGYARNGSMTNGQNAYGFNLPLGPQLGGPLFFAHYAYLGIDPRNLSDAYANYWTQNVNHTKINHAYCQENPEEYIGYSALNWGLTASDSHNGYSAHSPTNDLGVISPTAAVSSLPYTPMESMNAIRFFYYKIGDRVWGQYGFIDAFNPTEDWYADSYLAIDQGPQIIMIENHRTAKIWNLLMQNADIQSGLNKLNFTY